MRITNKFLMLFVAAFSILFASCSEETAEYEPGASISGVQAFFPTSNPIVIELQPDNTTFNIVVQRVDTTSAMTIPLSVEGDTLELYTFPEKVAFEVGEEYAEIEVGVDPELEFDVKEEITITLDDPNAITPYGNGSYTFTVSKPAPWTDLGMALYREDLMTTFFSVPNEVYQVPIQEDQTRPGVYRLLNPYGAYYPYNEDGDYDPDVDCYMVIHAEDPDHVWVEAHETTMDWSYGTFFFTSMVANYLANGNSMEAILANRPDVFGTLVDGIITMPVQSMLISMADYNDGGLYYANNNGLFAIALPGHDLVSYDYSARVSFVGILKGADESNQAVVDLTLAEDVASAKYAMTDASVSEATAANGIVSGELTEAEEISAGGRVYLPLSEDGKYRVTVVTFDANGEAQESASTTFEFEAGGSAWASIGMATYTDDIVGPLFEAPTVTYEVEVYTNENKPGIYRLKNPYGEAFPYNEPGDWDDSKDYFLEINAEDPTSVYFEEQELGVDWGYGMMSAVSDAARYLAAGYDVETIKANGIEFGTLKDGVITFPVKGIVVFDDDGGYYGNTNGAFKLVLPGATAGVKAHKAPARKHVSHKNKQQRKPIRMVAPQAYTLK